jgi:hypothetical protein
MNTQIHETFASILKSTMGEEHPAPSQLYGPTHNDQRRLLEQFRDVEPEHIQAIYEICDRNYERALATLRAAKKK